MNLGCYHKMRDPHVKIKTTEPKWRRKKMEYKIEYQTIEVHCDMCGKLLETKKVTVKVPVNPVPGIYVDPIYKRRPSPRTLCKSCQKKMANF